MLNLKKFYSDELLQIALLLSLMRVDPDSYLGIDMQTVNVGSLDLNNGSNWNNDAHHTIIHRPAFVHPKNLDSILLNYERDLFEDLNALGRYNIINNARNDIHAYLLNVNETAGPSVVVTETAENARNSNSPDPPMPTQTADDSLRAAELTQEDMDLIEVLWKQDVDLGFTLVDPTPAKSAATTSSKKESEDDIEKLKTLEAINGADDKKKSDVKEDDCGGPKDDDPWAELQYTVDLETGEYILSTASGGSGCSSASSDVAEGSQQQRSQEQQGEEAEEDAERRLLGEAGLGLGDVDELVGLGEDSLGLGLENDFTSELLGDGLLNDGVDGLLSNDSLGLPDGFNLEEALKLVGLDEVQLEKKPEVKKKSSDKSSSSSSSSAPPAASDGTRTSSGESRASTSKQQPASGQVNDDEHKDNTEPDMSTIHPAQYPHYPRFHHHHQNRMAPYHYQRLPDIPYAFPAGGDFVHPGASAGHHVLPHHAHHHPGYSGINGSQYADNHHRNVLFQNATLPPPVGELNYTENHYQTGAPSNLGSAVATSMNLTNSSEPMGPDTGAVYKTEPNDLMCFPNTTGDAINQTNDSFFSLLDEQLGAWPTSEDAFNVSDGLGYPASTNVQDAAAAIAHPGATTTTTTTVAGGPTDERMDASSDSAVSSMGSERVPSLSDGEWMETGSNSSHTQADAHYAMDYPGKYRMPYDCYSLPTGRSAGGHQRVPCHQDRGAMAPVAQKKHHMFGKRCFQEQPGPMTPGAAGSPLAQHPAATPIKYDYEAAQSIAAGLPGPAYSGPIEGAAGPQPEIKYSCSVDFARHHQSARSNLEHVHHNHTYHLPPESSGTLQRPISRDKKSRKSEADEHLTRDEKRARSLNVPIPVSDIINLPMDEFNERLSKYDLSETQLSLIRDIRRRGKNKVAAQNCRKRKLDQINSLSDEVKEMRNRKMRLNSERAFMLQELARVKEKFGLLYRHIFESLRDPDGHPYDAINFSLQLSADGNVVLVPRSNQSTGHYTRSTMDPSKKDHQHHHHHHQDHKE